MAPSHRLGIIGLGLIGGSLALKNYVGWATMLTLPPIIMAFGFAAAIGIFFGIYPAMKAARLNPIEALRYE